MTNRLAATRKVFEQTVWKLFYWIIVSVMITLCLLTMLDLVAWGVVTGLASIIVSALLIAEVFAKFNLHSNVQASQIRGLQNDAEGMVNRLERQAMDIKETDDRLAERRSTDDAHIATQTHLLEQVVAQQKAFKGILEQLTARQVLFGYGDSQPVGNAAPLNLASVLPISPNVAQLHLGETQVNDTTEEEV